MGRPESSQTDEFALLGTLNSRERAQFLDHYRVFVGNSIDADLPIEKFEELGKFVFGTLKDKLRQPRSHERSRRREISVIQRANENRDFIVVVREANASLFHTYFGRTVRRDSELPVCSVSERVVVGMQDAYRTSSSIYINKTGLWLKPSLGDSYASDEIELNRDRERGFSLLRGKDVLQKLWLDDRQRKLIKKFADMSQVDILKAVQKSFK